MHSKRRRVGAKWSISPPPCTDARPMQDPSATALALLTAAQPPTTLATAPRRCPLCEHPVRAAHAPDARCPACQSPLALLPGPGAGAPDLPGRRGAVRRDQSHVALLHVGWPSPPVPVRWRDLSVTGLSLYVPRAMDKGQRLRVIDSALDAVAEVVGCRPQGRLYVVHARLLTLRLLQTTGVFVSARA